MITDRIFFLFTLMIINISAFGQEFNIRGQVLDVEKKSLEFVDVVFLQKNDIPTKQSITDSIGFFQLKIKAGVYTLLLKQFGRELLRKTISIDQNIDLGEIPIDKSLILDEVTIKANRRLIKKEVDRLVFDVSHSVNAIGGNLIDVLKVTPGVSVMNDNVSIVGKNAVKLMVNNREITIPSGGLTNFLNSIPANEVERIEVITNPPSQFAAEDNYGLINIIYKKRQNSWTGRIYGNFLKTTYPEYVAGGNMSYYRNKFSLLLDVNGKKGSEGVIEDSKIYYPNQFWNGRTVRKDSKDYLSTRLSLQYDISKKVSIGTQYSGGFEGPDIKDNNKTVITGSENTTDSLIISSGNNNRSNLSHSLNGYAVIKLDTMGTILSLDVDYFKYIEDQDRDFRTETVFVDGTSGHNLSVYNNTSNQNINNYSFKADMVQPVKKIILNYGGRVSFINNQNAVSFFDLKSGKPVIDPLKSDQFNYKENIQALYFSASHKLANNKWSFKLGLRFENTNTKGVSQTLATTNKNNYSKFFPTAYVNYAPDKDNTFSLSYGKRIRRPRFWEINPFRWYVNDYTYSEGNPFLQPSYSDNYEFNYLYKGNLTAIAFLNVTDNGFGQIPSVDPSTNILALTRQNYFTKYNYGLGMVYSISSLAWLNSFFHSQIYYSDTKFNQDVGSALIGKEQNGFAYTFSNNTTLIFNKDKTLLGELNFWYLSPKKSGLYKEESAYSLSLGVKALFLKKNLQLGVNYYDIFKTSNPDMTTFYNNGTTRIANVYYDNRYLKVSAAYSFGNKKIKSIDRQTGNQEEKNRL